MQSGCQITAIHQQQQQQQQQQEQAAADQVFQTSQDHNFHHHLKQQLLFEQPDIAHGLYFQNPHQFLVTSPHYCYQHLQQQQQQTSDVNGGCGNVGGEAADSGSFSLVNCKLRNLNESNGANGENILSEDVLLLRGSGSQQHYAIVPSSQPSTLPISNCWHNQEDSAIKQPSWKPISVDVQDINYSKSCRQNKDKEEQQQMADKAFNCSEQMFDESNHQTKILENKCELINELEAIYQTGFGSVLSFDNSPTNAHFPIPLSHEKNFNAAANNSNTEMDGVGTIDHDSETSIGEKASTRKARKRRRKKNSDDFHLASMAKFFEGLVNRIMDHQEGLHKKFLEFVGKLDEETKAREEEWRQNQLATLHCEANKRAHQQALASSREAIIVQYLQQTTGQIIELPARYPLKLSNSAEPLNELSAIDRSSNDGPVPSLS